MASKSRGPLTPKQSVRIPPSAQLDSHETTGNPFVAWRCPQNVDPPAATDFQDGCTGARLAVRRATRREIAFRHSGWAAKRQKVAKALKLAGVPLERQERFHQCGASCSVLLNFKTGERKLVGSYCRDRFCMPCGTARGLYIAQNLRQLMADRQCRFITLTKRAFGLNLKTALDDLTAAFTKLRKSRFWLRHVKGGAAFIEVKRGKRSGDWHCHYHIICHGHFIDKRELSNAWRDITGDSYIVDVRSVDDNSGAAAYVCKYVGKPLDESVFREELDLVDCVLALRGRRLCNTFGDWRGVELEDRPDDGTEWIEIGPLDAILRLAEARNPDAFGVVQWFRREGWGEQPRADGDR